MTNLPLQPIVVQEDGVVRFKENSIVRYLLGQGPFTMDSLASIPFPQEDREQFAQLIGYSLTGFAELPYVSDKTYMRAERAARRKEKEAIGR